MKSIRIRHFLPTALACLSLLGPAHGGAQAPSPHSVALKQWDDEKLERAFWDCDTRSTREVLSMADGVLCVTLSDELKQRRFGGDFTRLMAWWRAHKDAEHARRSRP
jgi:hypothetical protein